VSAIFDAILFFMIMLAATGSVILTSSAITSERTEDISKGGRGRFASELHSSALACTIGPAAYRLDSRNLTFTGSVLGGIRTMLSVLHSSSDYDIEGLSDAVKGTYGLLVERPLHFALHAVILDTPTEYFISDAAASPGDIGPERWTGVLRVHFSGLAEELSLFLWR